MNKLASVLFTLFLSMAAIPSAGQLPDQLPGLEYGPYPVGFELIESADLSRSFPEVDGRGSRGRPMRVYVWYPVRVPGQQAMTVKDFVQMAVADFQFAAGPSFSTGADGRLPVPLAKGLDEPQRRVLLAKPLRSFTGLQAAPGEFPLLIVGQGLYYESPLSQAILCEYLASRGYIVATCPLLGTQYRLVNRNVEDLETQVRDMEFVVGVLRSRAGPKVGRLGIVGFDLGGMAGLILAMRHPEAEAFLSLDCAILFPMVPDLPDGHPSYREDRFTIPWMHMTQGRFIEAGRKDPNKQFLSDRKKYGETWLVSVPSDCHGQFSSYARFGIQGPLPGYWGPVAGNLAEIHDGICRLAGDFFDAVLKKDTQAEKALQAVVADPDPTLYTIEYKKNAPPPPSSSSLMHRIMVKGLAAVRPLIDKMRTDNTAGEILDETEFNWLGYHFLLWWGREDEALDVFELNAELHPESAAAYASLGEAYLILERNHDAVTAFRKALELNPDIPNIKALLERLTK